ncbi:MAG: phage terminase large subunit [Clostridia bacterium]|nr:phage terminase large subunit [Clostridia bacterium]
MEIKIGRPNPKQEIFLKDTHAVVGYGGARGGGKSWAVRTKAKIMALSHGGIKQLIVRRTYPELTSNHILPLRRELHGLIKYNDRDKRMDFPNGSSITFGYCASDKDLLRYQGQEYDVIYIDEATQLTEYQISVLRVCIRGVNDFPKRLYLTCNPGGVGHAYVKRIFIDREFLPGEKGEDYSFTRALCSDNLALCRLQPDYVDQLNALPDGLRRAWRDGDWDACEGAYFPEFRRDMHVCQPFEIPDSWRRFRAFDYGLDCFACLWVAVDSSGNAFVYRELAAEGLGISAAAEMALSLTPDDERIYCTYAPPDMWTRSQESGKEKAYLFRAAGLGGIVRSSNDRESGWLCIKELLRLGADGQPRLKIFSNCAKLIKHLPLLQIDVSHPTDCSTQPHEITHVPDALRYFAVAWARPATLPQIRDERRVWSDDMLEDYRNASESERDMLRRRWGEPSV